MYRTDFWTLWEKARVGCFERTASKHVYYLGWNRSPPQVGCMRQVLRPRALGRPRGIGWRGRWERGSGWGIHVIPWLIHVSVWQNPLQCCEVINLQLIKINLKKFKKRYWQIQWGANVCNCCFILCGSVGKESTRNAGDLGSIPGLGICSGEGKGYPLQYSGLENSMDWLYSPWGCKESDMTEWLSLSLMNNNK